jgi:hypothetical protein
MTGSAKQSILSLCRAMDCIAALAMTVKYRSSTTTVIPREGGVSSTLRLIGSIN